MNGPRHLQYVAPRIHHSQTPPGQRISAEDARSIVAFLEALSGPVPASARLLPELPLSSKANTHPVNQ